MWAALVASLSPGGLTAAAHDEEKAVSPPTSPRGSKSHPVSFMWDDPSGVLRTQEGDAVDPLWASTTLKTLATFRTQLSESKESLLLLEAFLAKYAKFQRELASDLAKLCRADLQKAAARDPGDLMVTFNSALTEVLQGCAKLADVHLTQATQLEAVHEEVRRITESYRKQRKEILNEDKEQLARLEAHREAISRQKKAVGRAMEVRASPKVPDPKARAYEAAVRYEGLLEEGRGLSEAFVAHYVPNALNRIQHLEELRFLHLRKAVGSFASSFQSFSEAYDLAHQHFVEVSSGRMNLTDDLRVLIERASTSDPPEAAMPGFELPLSMQELRGLVEPESKGQFRIGQFEAHSLDGVMAQQAQEEATRHLHLPVPMLRFRDAIRRLNGYSLEGLFRVSADQRRLEAFIEATNSDRYDFAGCDAHIATAALKQWLRELQSGPLVPRSQYEACVGVNVESAPEVCGAVDALPAANRAMVHFLVGICREVLQPEYAITNKMTVESMAILFGPYVIKEGSDAGIDGYMSSHAKETAFTSACITLLELDLGVLDEGEPDLNEYGAPAGSAGEPAVARSATGAASWGDDEYEEYYEEYDAAADAKVRAAGDDGAQQTAALPAGWEKLADEQGNVYYYNEEKQLTQWEVPES